MLAHAHVNDGGHRRDHDHGGVGGQVANGAHEADDEGQQLGGHVAQFVVQEGHDQAGLLAHTDGQSHGQHQAQGGEAGEVGDHVLQEPQKSVFRNGVLDGHDLIGGGVDHRYTHQT